MIEGIIEVLLHKITYRFWDLSDETPEELKQEAETRVEELIKQGFCCGELNYNNTRGWWEINC